MTKMLAMYPSGSNDKTWMYTMTPPFPSATAPGRWDTSSVVGFTPKYYGPHVPWTYSTPYLYGAGLGETAASKVRGERIRQNVHTPWGGLGVLEDKNPFGLGMTMVALGVGVVIGFVLGKTGSGEIDFTQKHSR
jgi:hypothetical protein